MRLPDMKPVISDMSKMCGAAQEYCMRYVKVFIQDSEVSGDKMQVEEWRNGFLSYSPSGNPTVILLPPAHCPNSYLRRV